MVPDSATSRAPIPASSSAAICASTTTYGGGVYDAPFWSGDGGMDPSQGNRFTDRINTRSRMALTVDTRTATEYGVVRTFGQADFQFSTYGGTTANQSRSMVQRLRGTLNNDTPGNGYTAVEMVFIQFAGFTFGKSASAYALPWNGYGGNNNSSFLMGGPDYVTGVNNIQYTAQFGNGVSATIGLDEGKVFNRTELGNLDVYLRFRRSIRPMRVLRRRLTAVISGRLRHWVLPPVRWSTARPADPSTHMADSSRLISLPTSGSIRPGVSSSSPASRTTSMRPTTSSISRRTRARRASPRRMARAAISFARSTPGGHPTLWLDPCSSLTSGHPDSKWGGAITAGLQLKNLPTGVGRHTEHRCHLAKGDTKAVISTSGASPSFAMFSGTGGPNPSVGLVTSRTACSATATSIATGQRVGHQRHPVDQCLRFPRRLTSTTGTPTGRAACSAAHRSFATTARAKHAYCNSVSGNPPVRLGQQGLRTSRPSTCDPNFNVYQLGFKTGWTPVKNLTFSGEVFWTYLDQNWTGTTRAVRRRARRSWPRRIRSRISKPPRSIVRAQRNF